MYWNSVPAFNDHIELHSGFFPRLIRPGLVAMGMNPAAEKKILGPRGPEPWIGLGFAQLPLFAVAQISDPVLTLQS